MTTLLVMGYMGVFMIILGTLASFALELSKYGRGLYDREQALHSAEAGLEYYRWYLAHFPNDLQNGTGVDFGSRLGTYAVRLKNTTATTPGG